MNKSHLMLSLGSMVLAGVLSFAESSFLASAHEAHERFSAGVPGDPKQPARTVKITMFEDGKRKSFEPDMIEVRRGEQIRFVITNDGGFDHEFMLATKQENKKHAALMKKFPDMEHADPNAIRLPPQRTGEIIWKFTKRGEFEYGCLIPGHYEAGMYGKLIVK